MAMIQCPECGRTVSEMASACPECGYPISRMREDGLVTIKLKLVPRQPSLKHKIKKNDTGELLWEGRGGEVATFKVQSRTAICISCRGNGKHRYVVEPNKKYSYQVVRGLFREKFILTPVDFFDD